MKSYYVVTTTYHTKPGSDKDFLNLWEKEVLSLASHMGTTSLSIYQNEETGEYLSLGYWNSMENAEKFFASKEFYKLSLAINRLSLIPPIRTTYTLIMEEHQQQKKIA